MRSPQQGITGRRTTSRRISRATHRAISLIGVLATVVVAGLWQSSTAFAMYPPPDPESRGVSVPNATVVTHTVSNTGLSVWMIVAIAAVAVAAGIALSELFHAARRHGHVHGLAVA
ncbi:MAG: hypothetical protein JWO88_2420 [Frankiales bacterium]|nr:hypothetical protein [Frankiales bacterium]